MLIILHLLTGLDLISGQELLYITAWGLCLRSVFVFNDLGYSCCVLVCVAVP